MSGPAPDLADALADAAMDDAGGDVAVARENIVAAIAGLIAGLADVYLGEPATVLAADVLARIDADAQA
jgi:hypothetical protein